MPKTLRLLIALLALGACWGLTPALAKLVLGDGMRPLGIAGIAASISTVILLSIAAAKRDLPRMTPAHLRHYVAGGLVGMGLANLFAFTGLQRAPAGLFSMMVPLSALFAMAGLDRVTKRRFAGTMLGLAGVLLAMSPGAALPDPEILRWAAIMLLTPVCYAASNLISVKLAVPGSSALAQAAGTVMGAAASSLLLAALVGHLTVPANGTVVALLLLHGVANAAGYLVYFRLLTQAGGVITSQASMTITLCGLGFGYLLFGEVPGWLTLPATALIFAGLLLVTTQKVSRETP